MKFSELVDISELRGLCESFTAITGAVTAILDLEGDILTASGWQDICTRFHRVHPATASRCRESDTVLAGRLGEGERYNVYKCQNGLIDVAVPITIGGEHVANFFTGQFFFEPPDKEYFIRQAEEFGFDKDSYIEALDKVPVFSEDKVRSMMEFFTRLAQLIGEMGLARKNMAQANAELRKHQEHLEELVMERTAELSRANRELQAEIAGRKRAVDALRESEERYRSLVELAPDAIIIHQDGRLVYANAAGLQLYGAATFEQLQGRHVLELIHPDERDAVHARMIRVQEGGEVLSREFRMLRLDGREVPVEATGILIDYQGKPAVQAIIRDITERKKVEDALRLEKNVTDTVINSMPGIFYVFDDDEQLIRWNKRLEEFSGRSPEAMPTLRPHDFVAEENHGLLESKLREVFVEYRNADVELLLLDRDGKKIPFYCTGSPMTVGNRAYLVGLGIDISERKRAEEARRKSEKKFLTVFHAVPALLGITTLAEGRFIDVNETCMRILGYQREEMIGRTSLELGIWESELERNRVIRALEEQGTVRDIEINLRGKTGESFAGLMSAEFIDIDGEQYVLSMINDITARKRAEMEIEILNTNLADRAFELETANQELETFNYSVSHDLRKPLTVINSYCQMVQELCGNRLDEQCRGYLQEAYDGTLRMNRLIDILLNFSRLTHIAPRRETVDLSGMAQAVAAELQLAEPARGVAFRITEGIKANGDANLLRVVLDNLLGNAWKYIGTRDEGVIEFGVTEVDGKPAFFVRDNGAGFDMAGAEIMFQPFQRLPGAEECRGFGIGLATVERIVRRHGGRVWAESEPGKGATFYFTLE
jgi:PAS domain S-box-containing protein